MSPRVSILLNTYNGEATLAESIDIAIAQTYLDWELIVWDDCSTDGTVRIAESYNDPRIGIDRSPVRVFLGQARDRAIQTARGEWIAFLDQDDLWLPDKLARQLVLADEDPQTGFIYGRTVSFQSDGFEKDFDHRHEFHKLPEGNIIRELFIDSCFIAMSSALLRRSLVDEIGVRPAQVQVTPDYFLFLAAAYRTRVRAVQSPVCRYRLHGGSMSAANRFRIQDECLELIEHWSAVIGPELTQVRIRVHQTVRAFYEITSGRSILVGLGRLLTRGSLIYLLSRPWTIVCRAARQRLQTPFYRRNL